ncbi:hypothetical protein [Nostoc sp. UIC 10630]|uniref:hypothetical protein n=1 Tax=Nostoc sp. UIC 10630 TaxID=2100146 RepID=UPI0013D2E149|nr:hypothetical protein [Nostoc sp. UIC 10630]NEU77658.1 hypothetical protein [Nostoc sp. UIC 10630]
MKLPELPREPIRNEDQPGYEKQIWSPSWKCFCCQDTGRIHPHLVKLIIRDYDFDCDRIPICQNSKCKFGVNWLHLGSANIDMRLNAAICQELDRFSREDWKRTTQQQFEKYRKRIESSFTQIAQSHSFALSHRTSNHEREVQQRKAEIEAITPEQWEAMNKAYLVGSNKDE